MDIQILQLLEGAKRAEGLTVIIDVFRAFSFACYACGKGVNRIYPVGNIEDAYLIKQEHPDYILAGERNEQRPEGFDFGNSPSQIMDAELNGRIMVHTTSSGTQGIANACRASEIITGSFVNAEAIVRYARQHPPSVLSLVCMGYSCAYPSDEDTFLSEYLKAKLEGTEVDFEEMVRKLRTGAGARFFVPEKQEWAPESDFGLCLDLDRFNFVLKVANEGGRNYLEIIDLNKDRLP